MAVLDIH